MLCIGVFGPTAQKLALGSGRCSLEVCGFGGGVVSKRARPSSLVARAQQVLRCVSSLPHTTLRSVTKQLLGRIWHGLHRNQHEMVYVIACQEKKGFAKQPILRSTTFALCFSTSCFQTTVPSFNLKPSFEQVREVLKLQTWAHIAIRR